MSKFEFVWECELTARFDSRASFYGKAMVKLFNHNGKEHYRLYSYGTLVMIIEKDVDTGNDKLYRLDNDGLYSATTLRHCKEFLKQLGSSKILFIPEVHKKDILNLPIWEE